MRQGCLDIDGLAELFHGREAARETLERHVDVCDECRALVAAYAIASDDTPTDPYIPAAKVVLTNSSETTIPHRPGATHEKGELIGGRYRLEHIVGEGGMGVVWAASDLVSGRKVALKLLKSGSAELVRRFWREVGIGARIRHPSLVDVLDVALPVADGEAPVLVMPLLEGEPLDALLAREKILPYRQALEILEPVVAGMSFAHARGVIHRDLKPSNVFIAEDGTSRAVLVLDFGLAKILSDDATESGADRLTRTGALLGTPSYMAPEQLFGESLVDARADVWAIGAMAYECLSGHRPVDGRSYGQIARNVARQEIPILRERAPEIPAAVADIVDRMLAKEREGRPSLAEVHSVFRSILDSGAQPS